VAVPGPARGGVELASFAVELLEALLIPWHVTHRVREDAATL